MLIGHTCELRPYDWMDDDITSSSRHTVGHIVLEGARELEVLHPF